MTAYTSSPAPLGASYRFIWGLAALGTALISGTFAALLPIFYQDYLGLAARWIWIGATIYAIWNALNDPLFGYITDSTRSKRGRRIPYMRFTAPFLALMRSLLKKACISSSRRRFLIRSICSTPFPVMSTSV